MSSESVRVNISLSIKCIEKINECIHETHVFNGKSDFILASIRDLMMEINKKMYEKINKITHTNYREIIDEMWVANLNNMLFDLEKQYKSDYGGPNVKQISIRLSNDVAEEINNRYLQNTMMDLSHFIRLSIVCYFNNLSKYYKII